MAAHMCPKVVVKTRMQILPGTSHHCLWTREMSSSQGEILKGTIVQYTVRNVTSSHTELGGYAMTHLEAPDASDIEDESNDRLLKSIRDAKYYDQDSYGEFSLSTSRLAYIGGQTVFEAYAWERIMIDGTFVFMDKQSGFVTHKSPLRFEESF